jgi:flagellar motor switch protein FliN
MTDDSTPAFAPAATQVSVAARAPIAPIAPNHVPLFRALPVQSQKPQSLDALRDVELTVQIELGRTRMRLDDVLRLEKGAVVALDRLAGDPVDVFANGQLIARGEVVVLNEKFAVRVTEVVSPLREEQAS